MSNFISPADGYYILFAVLWYS